MELLKARVLGFCMGVRRAVEMAEAELDAQNGDVFTLGPLIHNPQVLGGLEERGIKILDPSTGAKDIPPDTENVTVIIRAHGIAPAAEASLRRRGARIVDATCPKVKASQLAAKALAEQGACVFIAGERDHAEVIGIAGYVDAASGERALVVGGAREAEAAAADLKRRRPRAKTALIAQTTLSVDEYAAIAGAVKAVFPLVEVRHTICGATCDRQDALRDLCAVCDAIIVAGGRDSANTRRLLAIAKSLGKKAEIAESAACLSSIPFLRNASRVGLCAGASTPDSVIAGIAAALEYSP
ncbi:MAG: 4-hydroxy-3-methylbut-2-enyl diphosphate reductase [Treponema sp.]|nr:4-hydroxy-3-methylbut-2-enyl diphosphate reductase [Treponema sp.]